LIKNRQSERNNNSHPRPTPSNTRPERRTHSSNARVEQVRRTHELIFEDLNTLATPGKATSASTTAVLNAMNKLRTQVREISRELESARSHRTESFVNSGIAASDGIVKGLDKASRIAAHGGVQASWEAKELYAREVGFRLESLLKDARVVAALARIPSHEEVLLLEGTIRTWQYDIEKDLGTDLSRLPYSEVAVKSSGMAFYTGGIEDFIIIVSVAANIATLAQILYEHFRKEKNPEAVIRVRTKGRSTDIQISSASLEQIREVLELCVERRKGRRASHRVRANED